MKKILATGWVLFHDNKPFITDRPYTSTDPDFSHIIVRMKDQSIRSINYRKVHIIAAEPEKKRRRGKEPRIPYSPDSHCVEDNFPHRIGIKTMRRAMNREVKL